MPGPHDRGDPYGSAVEEIETDHFYISHYAADPRRVVVSFASLGFAAVGGPIEEFKRTLGKTGVSCIFVTDRGANWYNNPQTDIVFQKIAEMCAIYENVGAIGESAGACGTLLLSRYFTDFKRILAFSPQFSIAAPFRGFDDERDLATKRSVVDFYNIDFSGCCNKQNIYILYGNADWRDYLHSTMYRSLSFNVGVVDGADHDVAGFLKKRASGDLLTPLVTAFCEFDAPFDANVINDCLGDAATTVALKINAAHLYSQSMHGYINRPPGDAVVRTRLNLMNDRGNLLSQGRPAEQSSVSQWSDPGDSAGDAAGAVDGVTDKDFGFHTDHEDQPWWQVDLERSCLIKEVRIYNRAGTFELAQRSASFKLLVRDRDETHWRVLFTYDGLVPFGLDGRPFVWRAANDVAARYIRIKSTKHDYLHLRQVEVFGFPMYQTMSRDAS